MSIKEISIGDIMITSWADVMKGFIVGVILGVIVAYLGAAGILPLPIC
jgi:hypothetical protein